MLLEFFVLYSEKYDKVKSKAILVTGYDAYRVVRYRGSHIFQAIGSRMEMRLSVSREGHPLTPERFLALISVRG
jgi:hypothetical protein